jgi:hypothetical protein
VYAFFLKGFQMATKAAAKKPAPNPQPPVKLAPLPDTLKRCLSGEEPRNRQETFWWFRWQRLTHDHRRALCKRWNLPGEAQHNPTLARQAIKELG